MLANNLISPAPLPPAPPASFGAGEALGKLCARNHLSEGEAEQLFTALVAGQLGEAQIAALLIALRVKGETGPELIGAARALRAADREFERPDYLFADCCGTGGDQSGSINVSTATAFVAAAAGLPIVKHGNRSFTSRCGSADVLEALGARLDLSVARSRRLLDETSICFLFAPLYHPGLKYAGPVRQALKVRTVMNLLGPCLNPAEPPVQLLGVADPQMLEPIALTLASLGVERALVVHGSGLDEVALHAETVAVRLLNGKLEPLVISPEQAGLKRAPVDAVKGGDANENAERLIRLLAGNASEAETNLVALNTGALLMTAGLAADLSDGVAQAINAINSGAAATTLQNFIEASRA